MEHLREMFLDIRHFIFPDDCYEELVTRFNVSHPVCPNIVLSRVLGLAITAGSMALFIPQILKIAAARSGKGISFPAQLLTLVGVIGMPAYSYDQGFVFSQWGDGLFSAIQLVIICMQLLYFDGRGMFAAVFAISWAAAAIAVYIHAVPPTILAAFLSGGTAIVIVAKAIQIYQNWSQRSTGQLAFITVLLQFAGSLARIFTSMQETHDFQLIMAASLATLFNGSIFAQFLIYWNKELVTSPRTTSKTPSPNRRFPTSQLSPLLCIRSPRLLSEISGDMDRLYIPCSFWEHAADDCTVVSQLK
ncbi:unnamed protein product, partial [Mesorhabditis spiculigera]